MRAGTRRKCSPLSAPPAIRVPAVSAGRWARLPWPASCASTTRPAASKRPRWPVIWPHLPTSRRRAHSDPPPHGRNKHHKTVKTKGRPAGGGRRPRTGGRVSPPVQRHGAGGRAKTAGSRNIPPPRRRPLRPARDSHALRKPGRHGRVHRPKLPRSARRVRRLRQFRRPASRRRPTSRRLRYPARSRIALPPRGPTTSPIDAIFSLRAFPRRPPPRPPCRGAPRRLRARKMLRPPQPPPPARFPRDAR
jgi:hypothetical protein